MLYKRNDIWYCRFSIGGKEVREFMETPEKWKSPKEFALEYCAAELRALLGEGK